jgi:hypothetical protein
MAIIKRAGLVEAEAFWFWPNFETCTKIIPLDAPNVLLHSLAPHYADASLQEQVKATCGRWFLKSGLLEFVAPCFGIVAQRSR